ncbi:hypothetical protein C8R44DRAFT_741989 [Mycena epipterygia]|nr:hypothetical protein C8R44DRAFT_741989 [Mycena epipterygia]
MYIVVAANVGTTCPVVDKAARQVGPGSSGGIGSLYPFLVCNGVLEQESDSEYSISVSNDRSASDCCGFHLRGALCAQFGTNPVIRARKSAAKIASNALNRLKRERYKEMWRLESKHAATGMKLRQVTKNKGMQTVAHQILRAQEWKFWCNTRIYDRVHFQLDSGRYREAGEIDPSGRNALEVGEDDKRDGSSRGAVPLDNHSNQLFMSSETKENDPVPASDVKQNISTAKLLLENIPVRVNSKNMKIQNSD